MAPEYVSSDVMNFLVWRYLEEAGYHKAADRLQRSWIGHNDPEEEIPFAPRIQRNALINLVQDGLFLDNLESEVKNASYLKASIPCVTLSNSAQKSPRYTFGSDHGPKYSLQTNETREPKPKRRRLNPPLHKQDAEVENGLTDDSKRIRGGKVKRKSGSRASRMNGETTDLDTNGAIQAHTTESAVDDAETPIEIEEELIPIVDTLTIGESQETEPTKPQDLLPNTTFCNVVEAGSHLPYVRFSPTDPSMLFLGGENALKMCKTTDFSSKEDGDDNVDINMPNETYEIETFCWVTPGAAVIAVSQPLESDEQVAFQSRLVWVTDWGEETNMLSSVNGPVYSLQYQKSTNDLLCLSGGERSTIYVWQLTRFGPELLLRKRADIPIYDAAWIGERHFIGGGVDIVGCWTYTFSGTMHSINPPTQVGWQNPNTHLLRLRVSAQKNFVAMLAENMREIAVVRVDSDGARRTLQAISKSRVFDDVINEFEFSPTSTALFATLFRSGVIHLWSAPNFNEAAVPSYQFSMGNQASAMTFSFSPLGGAIAAAGYSAVMIWEVAGERSQGADDAKARWIWPDGDEHWKCTPAEDDDRDWVHSLSWDADGKKIAFGLDGQVAIIRLGSSTAGLVM